MSDNPQQPEQPPAGPGWGQPPALQPNDPAQQPAYPPPPGYAPQPAPGWGQPQQPGYPPQPGWGQPQPGWGQPQPGWGQPQQPGYPPQQGYPQQGGWGTPPPGYAQPGYAPQGYQPQPGYLVRYAGFWIRVGAFLLDGFILLAITIGLAITVFGILALPFVWILYRPLCWWKRGGTFGQTALGLRVVREQDGGPIDGAQATVRFLGSLLSGWALYLGYIWVAFEPRKRGWHDMMAGTVVVHVN